MFCSEDTSKYLQTAIYQQDSKLDEAQEYASHVRMRSDSNL